MKRNRSLFLLLCGLLLVSPGCQAPTAPAAPAFSYRIESRREEVRDGVPVSTYYLEGEERQVYKYVPEQLSIVFLPWNRTPDTLRLWKDFGVAALQGPPPEVNPNHYLARLSVAHLDLSQLPTYAVLQGLHGSYVFSSETAAKTFQQRLALQQAQHSLGIHSVSIIGYLDPNAFSIGLPSPTVSP